MNSVHIGAIPNAYLPSGPAPDLDGQSSELSFGDVLKNAVHSVNGLNDSADMQVNNMLQNGNGDMNSVMIAVEKADVSFQLMMQVRNKIVSAYQDIEKMQF
jgi:flagellar hook-basal body complex protein FliE